MWITEFIYRCLFLSFSLEWWSFNNKAEWRRSEVECC